MSFMLYEWGNGTIESNTDSRPFLVKLFSSPVTWIVIACVVVVALVIVIAIVTTQKHRSKEFTIMLNNDGDIETMIVKQGANLRLPMLKRDGYRFAGWFEDTAFTVPFLQSKKIHSDLMLYAKWVKEAE